MLIRLRDFAEQNRITDRTVQIHIKENQEILEGHVERRGKQGTWLDDFAVAFLLDRIQLPTKDEVLVPTPREANLLLELSKVNALLADAERRAGENAAAAGKLQLLEEQSHSLKEVNADLLKQVFNLERDAQEAEERAAAAEERERIALQELEKERNKSFWDKLFGK